MGRMMRGESQETWSAAVRHVERCPQKVTEKARGAGQVNRSPPPFLKTKKFKHDHRAAALIGLEPQATPKGIGVCNGF